ncbi:hypothetical protein SAMN05216366_104107 [Selenomonas ruminantium]|uniref:Uncharacterized protein n=1 Tax=Selenomonas ruminantium TaxID=971 RepID=A0A1H0P4D5_SELRU|nr:hypothetical protein SAMN05216366_104107 [Selenomonas ruminantium]
MSKSRKRKTLADLFAREAELLAMMNGTGQRPRYLKRQLKSIRIKIRRSIQEDEKNRGIRRHVNVYEYQACGSV